MSREMPMPNPETESMRYPSLASLRAAHTDLLKRYRERGDEPEKPEILTEIEQLMRRGRETGAVLGDEDDRWTAQGLLDYWSSLLYRVGQVEPPDATLVEFDSSLAPDLDDDLCPYLGLEAFQAEKQHLFFGRQRLLDKLLKHVTNHRLLMLVGASGSGKSSVVMGGLLPKLAAGGVPGSERWVYHVPVVPGANPLAALARRLKPAQVAMEDWVPEQVAAFQRDPFHLLQLLTAAQGERTDCPPVVLFIDQFEEVFTLCQQDAARAALVQNLVNFVQVRDRTNRLILTMRTDFESQLVRMPELLELFEDAHIRTTALEANELRSAIAQPAALVGLRFEEGLIDELLSDVLGEPAALPLLQFTLLKLWDHRDRNRVTWEAYRRLGGGRLALARSADEFYDGLIPEDQVTMKRILLRMVRPGEGLEVTSQRIPTMVLYRTGEAKNRVDRVLKKLIQARLVRLSERTMPGDAQVEVAHEALIRNWPQLVNWLEDERTSLRQRLRLTAAAEQWQRKKRDSSTLLRGLLLEEALNYEDLSELENDFIRASIRVEKRSRNILLFAGALVILSLSVTSIFALMQAKQAKKQTAVAEILEAAARSKNLVDTTDAALGLALAITAMDRSQQLVDEETFPAAADSLLNGLQTAQEQNLLSGHESTVFSVAFSPNGQHIVSGSADKTVRIWDAETGEQISQHLQGRFLQKNKPGVFSMAVSPTGQHFVTSNENNIVQIWDTMTGKQTGQSLQGHTDNVRSVAFSPDGQRIVSSSADNTVRIWDVTTGEQIGQPLRGHTDSIWSVAFSFDGQHIVSGSEDNTIRIWNVSTGKQIGQSLQGHTSNVFSVAFSPDGQRIVSGSEDNTVRIWDMATGEQIGKSLQGHTSNVFSVAFSLDNQRIVSGSEDNTVRVWNVSTGEQIGQPLQGHTNRIFSVAFSPDGQQVVSGSEDNTVRIWDVSMGEQIGQPLQNHTDSVWSVSVSPDGKTLASGSGDGTVRMWDAVAGEPIGQPLKGHKGKVLSVAFSPDGKTLVSGSFDEEIRLWNAATGKPIDEPLTGHDDPVFSVAFSPDGKTLVSGSGDGTVRLWNVTTGKPIGQPLKGHTDWVLSVAIIPGVDRAIYERIVSGSADGTVRIWDTATREQIGLPLQGHTNSVWSVAVSPDGRRLISGGDDKIVRTWDVATGKSTGRLLEGHTGRILSVAFSHNGQRIVSGSDDSTVRIWDAATGKSVGQPLQGHTSRVMSVAISPDGQRIFSGSEDKTVRIWEYDWRGWMQLACDRLQYHPLLTASETILSDEKSLAVARAAEATCDAPP